MRKGQMVFYKLVNVSESCLTTAFNTVHLQNIFTVESDHFLCFISFNFRISKEILQGKISSINSWQHQALEILWCTTFICVC